MPGEWSELVELAKRAAAAAGQAIMPHFRSSLAVQTKADGSPVTIADKNAEQAVVQLLRRHRPNDGCLGEEFGGHDGSSGYRWIIDPIDGTVPFVHGVPLFGTLLAVQKDGQTIIGLINMPALGEMIVGVKGYGTLYNGRVCRVSQVSELAGATVLTSNINNLQKYERQNGFARLVRQARETRTWGDCYGYLLVATGRAEIMIDPVVAAWDITPMEPIITEAGGRLTDLAGRTGPDITHALATNGLLHEKALDALHNP